MSLDERILVRAGDSSSGPAPSPEAEVAWKGVTLKATAAVREPRDRDSRGEPDVLGNGLDDLHAEREQAREVILQLSAEVRRLRSATDEAVGARHQELEDRLMDLARKATACVADRDALIERLREQARANSAEVARLKLAAGAAVTGALSGVEARARMHYETGRLGATTLWALLMVRSLPAMPLISLLVFELINTLLSGGHGTGVAGPGGDGPGKAYLVASGASVVAAALSIFCGVMLQWLQLGPRWIWLRRVDAQARTLEALTSGGEGLVISPENVIVELSPLMSLLGLGVVRRRDNGQKYVTSEPAAWLQVPGRPRARRRLGLDLLTLLSLAVWAAVLTALCARG